MFPKRSQNGPKWTTDAVWTPLGTVLKPFWKYFGTILANFFVNLEWRLEQISNQNHVYTCLSACFASTSLAQHVHVFTESSFYIFVFLVSLPVENVLFGTIRGLL